MVKSCASLDAPQSTLFPVGSEGSLSTSLMSSLILAKVQLTCGLGDGASFSSSDLGGARSYRIIRSTAGKRL